VAHSQGNPKKIAILGTRHCTFLHQQIVELLSYALVLSGNHVYTSGAIGTHTAVIRGALRAENQSLLTVILPQTIERQPEETRELLAQVEQLIQLGHNELPLSYASRLCNSELLTKVGGARATRFATCAARLTCTCPAPLLSRRDGWRATPSLAPARATTHAPSTARARRCPVPSAPLPAVLRIAAPPLPLAPRALLSPLPPLSASESPNRRTSELPDLRQAEQLIVFAFHDSHTLKEAVEEGKQRGMLVTVLWLD
jgi:hypothetical protein